MSYLDMVRRLTDSGVPKTPEIAKEAEKVPPPPCVECGDPIASDEPECWWGLHRVHLDCGKAAWRREWRGELADAPGAAAH